MRIGKLSSEELSRLVISKTTLKNKEIVQSAGLAEDCAAIKSDKILLLTTDPITGAGSKTGRLAVTVASNDVAVGGGTPVCCLLTIIAPPTSTPEEIESLMSEAAEAAASMNIDIVGGHTEFSDAVNRIIVSCTMVGTAKKLIKTGGAKAGESIVMTKSAAIEATAIIACDHREKLLAKGFTQGELDEAESYIDNISVLKDAEIAMKYEVSSMHDVTEGGVYGAVSELAEASGLGATVYRDDISVTPLTAKICKALKVSPMRIIGSGSILIVTPVPDKIIKALKKAGIDAAVIGTMRSKKEITAIGEGVNEELKVMPDQLMTIK